MADRLDYSGKTVLVVGGTTGIGNAIARAFKAQGADVHVWGTRSTAADYAGEADSNLDGIGYTSMDVTDFDAIAAHSPAFSKLDVLVLCQGKVLYKRQEFQAAKFRQVVDVNLNSLMACSEKFQPMLAESKGSLILISSTAAYHATFGNPAYGASKTGAMGLTRNLGQAWAPLGIRVNGIAPGLVPTRMTTVTTQNPDRVEATLSRVPAGRLGRPEDMAEVALFLASPMASYVIGQTIIVDGGLTL